MQELLKSITGSKESLIFSEPIIQDNFLSAGFQALHSAILEKETTLSKTELFYFFISELLANLVKIPSVSITDKYKIKLNEVKKFLEINCSQTIALEALSDLSGLNKHTLIRTFTKQFGLTPYQYIKTMRIKTAKELLAKGSNLSETGLSVGFSNQSHFTRVFKMLIGVTPKQYQAIFKLNGDIILENKCVILIDNELPLGVIANTATILGITLGRNNEKLVGANTIDANNVKHAGIVYIPVPILKSTKEKLQELRRTLTQEKYNDVEVVEFTDLAQQCKTYEDYIEKSKKITTDDLTYLGLGLYVSKNKIKCNS